MTLSSRRMKLLLNCLAASFLYIFSMHYRRVWIVSLHVPTLISGIFFIWANKFRIISRMNRCIWLKLFWAPWDWLSVNNFRSIFLFNLLLAIWHLDVAFLRAESWIPRQMHLWLFLVGQLHWGLASWRKNRIIFLTEEIRLRFARVHTLVPRRLKLSYHVYFISLLNYNDGQYIYKTFFIRNQRKGCFLI